MFVQMKGLFSRGDNNEIVKISQNKLKYLKKISSPVPLGQFQPNFAQGILG